MYVTCNFQGRLGNLLYEIAAVLATAWRQKLAPVSPAADHPYYKDLPAYQQYIKRILSKFKSHNGELAFKIHEETPYQYTQIPELKDDTILKGYFTSWRYFDDYRDRIIDLFSTDKVYVIKKVVELRHKYDKEIIGVHVRRTDYVTDYRWDLPLDYYKKAREHFGDCVFLIFSDDKDWCRKNLTFMEEKEFVSERDYIEMQLMGRFDGLIIANSTFSVWGAILGDQKREKKIIAPTVWQTRSMWNVDVHEQYWIKI